MIYLVLVIISLFSAGIEAISYPGFIATHLHIPAYFFYALSLALSFTYNNNLKKYSRLILNTGYALAVCYFSLILLETFTYPNYIYTTFHLNPVTFQLFIALFWFHALIIHKSSFSRSLLVAILVFVCVDGAGRTFGMALKGLRSVLSNPFATYDQKMAKAYPGFYPAMQEIKNLTPKDANIFIPPQGNPWEIEGNAAMVTYFLYPRKVANLDSNNLTALPSKSYLLIAKGSWPKTGDVDYGWPKIPIKATTIWNIDLSSKNNYSYKRDYSPMTDKWDWGLIEVANE